MERYMKNFLVGLILFFSVHTTAMTTVLQRTKRINPKNTPRNTQLCLHTPRDFGTKHFIVGYKSPKKLSVKITPVEEISVSQKPFIINGSSAHLIDESRHTQSFFTTVHNTTSIILEIFNQAQKSIAIAAFYLTDMSIANALIAAHKKGIDVRVIVDGSKMKERSSKVQKLIDNGIAVQHYDCSLQPGYKKKNWSDPIMHHKCMLIDNKIVITGSANATNAAKDNIENINILRDSLAVEEHRQEFTRLKKLCVECK